MSQAVRPLLARKRTVAEPLGRAMAPAAQATQGVTPARLHVRHEMTPVALHATLEAAAVHATLEAYRTVRPLPKNSVDMGSR